MSHIHEFAYVALLRYLSNSFYLKSKLPSLSSTLYLTFDVNHGIICRTKPKHWFSRTKIVVALKIIDTIRIEVDMCMCDIRSSLIQDFHPKLD